MIHRFGAALLLGMLAAGTADAQQAPAPQSTVPPAGQTQPAVPGAQPPPVPAPVQAPAPAPAAPGVPLAAPACPLPVPPATAPARQFTGRTGMLMYQVVPTRVADFDRFLAYVRDALAKTANATITQQASGWEFYKAAEPGPNGDVLYVFLFDPAVPCVDYAFFPILSEVYTDPALLQELHKLYTGALRTGGTLMNLVAIPLEAPRPLTPAAPGTPTTQTPPGQTPIPGAETPTTPASRVPIQPGQ